MTTITSACLHACGVEESVHSQLCCGYVVVQHEGGKTRGFRQNLSCYQSLRPSMYTSYSSAGSQDTIAAQLCNLYTTLGLKGGFHGTPRTSPRSATDSIIISWHMSCSQGHKLNTKHTPCAGCSSYTIGITQQYSIETKMDEAPTVHSAVMLNHKVRQYVVAIQGLLWCLYSPYSLENSVPAFTFNF